jgi:hypothetical protein
MITMPVWVFLLLFVGGVAWNVYLVWANSEARHDSELKRLGNVFDSDAVRDEDGIVHLVPRHISAQRDGSGS